MYQAFLSFPEVTNHKKGLEYPYKLHLFYFRLFFFPESIGNTDSNSRYKIKSRSRKLNLVDLEHTRKDSTEKTGLDLHLDLVLVQWSLY